MRKSITILFAAAICIMAHTGCNRETDIADTGNISIEASVGEMTKTSGTGFSSGDRISVYGWIGSATEIPEKLVVDGVVNTFNSNKWTAERQMLWKNLTDAHYFLGVYPVRNVSDFKGDPFTLSTDDYTANDLLVATNLDGVTASDGAVALAFDHVMAKLIVNLKFRNEWKKTPVVTSVTAMARSSATVDYLGKRANAVGEVSAVSIPAASSASEGYDASFIGIQVPQTGVRKITVTVDGKEYVYESAVDIPLDPGKYTTLGLNVGRDNIEFESFSVSDWTAEADILHIEALRDPSLSWESYGSAFDLKYDMTPITIKIKRLVANHPLEVPITLTDEAGVFSVSDDKVCFAAGEYEKTLTVSYKYFEIDPSKRYSFSLSFDEELGGAGCFSTFEATCKKALEYVDYAKGWYSGRYEVNTDIMAYVWIDGPIIDNLDSGTWILQRAMGTTNYYKMIIWDGLAEIEFINPGDGSFIFNKYPGYNDFVSKYANNEFDWTVNHKGDTWNFEIRANKSEISCSGEELVKGDYIELEGWVSKNGVWLGGGHNMYQDFGISELL